MHDGNKCIIRIPKRLLRVCATIDPMRPYRSHRKSIAGSTRAGAASRGLKRHDENGASMRGHILSSFEPRIAATDFVSPDSHGCAKPFEGKKNTSGLNLRML
jgi:hypothetical protein